MQNEASASCVAILRQQHDDAARFYQGANRIDYANWQTVVAGKHRKGRAQ